MLLDWSKIHDQDKLTPATLPLAALSLLYRAGLKLKMSKPVRKKKLPGFVVSLGNLTVGGTGKTPAAVMLAQWAIAQGYKPAILSRGYGGESRQKILEVSDGKTILTTPAEAGDEPYLLAKKLKGIPVIISKDRFDAGFFTYKKQETDFFILDDGFQHTNLHRDLDLVLLDSTLPFGNKHLLPWGPLREPIDNLRRADALILTRSDSDATPGLVEFLKKIFPEKPVFLSRHVPQKLIFTRSCRSYGPGFLTGKKVAAFTGIAKPEYLRLTLTKLGAEVLLFKTFPDHYPFSRARIEEMILWSKSTDCLLTTEKDWVRIENLGIHEDKFCYLTVNFELLSETETFFNMVREKEQDARLKM
ncbi:MAG: tetraacyldisaccharide 4'-kinase [Deltaproteobacteria bacterium]|nr:tetraacyldisaccharide 4'-kinase [Deltaproteobacteria bacterium]